MLADRRGHDAELRGSGGQARLDAVLGSRDEHRTLERLIGRRRPWRRRASQRRSHQRER